MTGTKTLRGKTPFLLSLASFPLLLLWWNLSLHLKVPWIWALGSAVSAALLLFYVIFVAVRIFRSRLSKKRKVLRLAVLLVTGFAGAWVYDWIGEKP